ncbi:O-antigen polymerase [Pseudoalteromonas piscicida]|uniref:O-antigen polymerase n=1 Tax=Pseudoalteromonas piscicida TaxID=43662 RepID=UPI0032C01D58
MIASFILILLFSFILYRIKRDENGVPYSTVLLLFYTQLTGVISCIYVNSGVYITEQGRESFSTSADVVYVILLFLFVFSFTIFQKIAISSLNKEFVIRSYNSGYFIVWSIAIVLLVLYANVFLSDKIPLFHNDSNRFTFWVKDAFLKELNLIFGTLSIPISSALGFFAFHNYYGKRFSNKKNRIIAVIFFFYLLYLALTGQRFNGFLVAIIFFMIPFFAFYKKADKKFFTKSLFIKIFAAITVMFVIVYYSYKNSLGGIIDEAGSPIAAMFYRIFVLQGHVFWGQYLEFINGGGTEDFFFNAMDSTVYLLTPSPDFFIENKINLANVFPGNILLSHGVLGVVFSILILALYFATLSILIVKALLEGAIFRYVLLMQINLWGVGGLPNFDLNQIFGFKVLAGWFIFFSIYFLSTNFKKSAYG